MLRNLILMIFFCLQNNFILSRRFSMQMVRISDAAPQSIFWVANISGQNASCFIC